MLCVLALTCAATTASAALICSAEDNGIVYFACDNPFRIERYDMTTETWSSTISLAGEPTAMTVDADGIYLAFGTSAYRYDLNGMNEALIRSASQNIHGLHVRGDQLFLVYSSGLYARVMCVSKTTGNRIEDMENYPESIFGSSFAPTRGCVFGRTQGITPSDIVRLAVNTDGTFGSCADSAYHGNYPDASRTYVFADETRVTDDSGTVYSCDSLTCVGSLGGAFDCIAFADNFLVLAQGTNIHCYSLALLETGSHTLSAAPSELFLRDRDTLFAFYDDGIGTPEVDVIDTALLSPPEPNQGLDPASISYLPDDVVLGRNDVIYLLSITNTSIFRWSAESESYLSTISLIGEPAYMAYSADPDRLYVAYDSGQITKIDVGAGSFSEAPFLDRTLPPLGLACAGEYLFVCDSSGSWDSHFTYSSQGNFVSQVDWQPLSSAYAWSDQKRKMYFFRDNMAPNDLLWESIGLDGRIGSQMDSPYNDGVGIMPPIRVRPDGAHVILGSGRIYEAESLVLANTLPYDLVDAAWQSYSLLTLHEGGTGNTECRLWNTDYIQQGSTLSVDGAPIRCLSTSRGFVVLVETNGTTELSILGGEYGIVTLDVKGTPVEVGEPVNFGYWTHPVEAGTTVTAGVPVSVIENGVRYECAGWTGTGDMPASGNSNSVTCTINASSTLTWRWLAEHWLEVTAGENGIVSDVTGWYVDGTNVTIQATPSNGYHLALWTGDVPSYDVRRNPITLTIDRSMSLEAVFAKNAADANCLMLHYSFDDDLGATILDTSGRGNDGLASGALWTPAGLVGGGSEFDGVDDYIAVTDETDVDFERTHRFTLTAWVKLTDKAAGDLNQSVIAKMAQVSGSHPRGYDMCAYADMGGVPALTLQRDADTYVRVYGQTDVIDDNWHQVVAVSQGDGTAAGLKLYVDGAEESVSIEHDNLGLNSILTDSPMTIGGRQISETASAQGAIDEVRVYSRALSPEEVIELYDATLGLGAELRIEGTPDRYGDPMPDGYGLHCLDYGSVVTNTVVSPVVDGTTRYRCAGWIGTGDAPVEGSSNSVSFTLNANATVTWQWETDHYLDVAAGQNGTVGDADGWYADGTNVTITATGLNGYQFTVWSGDVPAGMASVNPLTVRMDRPRSLVASFVPSSSPKRISGRVYYYGDQQGPVYVEAYGDASYSQLRGAVAIPWPGPYTIDGLQPGGDYWIRAYLDGDGGGALDPRDPVGGYALNPVTNLLFDVAGVHVYLERISSPQNVRAVGAAGSVELSWDANPEPAVYGYNVYRFDSQRMAFDKLNSAPITGLSLADTTAMPGDTHYYFITAVIRSEYTSGYMESPGSVIVGATAGQAVLWMPDYYGQTGGLARLQINVEDARGILADRMAVSVSYDPELLIPRQQVEPLEETVEITALTQGLTVSNNSAVADGVIDIFAFDPFAGGSNTTLKVLGCAYESGPNQPVPIAAEYSTDNGVTWNGINDYYNINNGREYVVELGNMTDSTDVTVRVTEEYQGHVRRTGDGGPYVKTFRTGDSLGVLTEVNDEEDLRYYLLPFVDHDMRINIGSNDIIYLVELSDYTNGAAADYQDVVLYVQRNEGVGMIGEGHLFDLLFYVTNSAAAGTQCTNRFMNVSLKDQRGSELGVDAADVGVFTVGSAYMLGDVTGDGVVDIDGDYLLAMQIAVGSVTPNADQLAAGDIDGNGEITKTDATLIRRLAEGLAINPEPGGGGGDGGPAGQTNGYEISIGEYEVMAGNIIQTPLALNNGTGVADIQVRLNYDQEILNVISVTNGALTSGFALAYRVGDGYVNIILSSTQALTDGSGEIAIVTFGVASSVEAGSVSELTISDFGLGSEYGEDLSWRNGLNSKDGVIWIVLSKWSDSDGDGLSDYQEHTADGMPSYDPRGQDNPYGTDTDVNDADTDDDHMSDGDEKLAGTSAVDDGSYLGISSVAADKTSSGLRIRWMSVDGIEYSVERGLDLSGSFTCIESNIVGTAPENEHLDAGAIDDGVPKYYRIKVE